MFVALFILSGFIPILSACKPPEGKIIKVTVLYKTCKEYIPASGLAVTLSSNMEYYRMPSALVLNETKYTDVNGTVTFGDDKMGNWICVPYGEEEGNYTISFYLGYQRNFNITVDCSKKVWEYTYYVGLRKPRIQSLFNVAT